jgi:predicted  nucleic acid-binding Zn-ribbon protein
VNDVLSLSEIEARIATEQAAYEKAAADVRDANERARVAQHNVEALKLLLRFGTAYAKGEAMPDPRDRYPY